MYVFKKLSTKNHLKAVYVSNEDFFLLTNVLEKIKQIRLFK